MSSMRSVIITLPKGMQKSTIVGADFNLTSLLNNNNNFKQQQLQNIGVKMEPEYDDMEYTDNDDVKQDGWSKGKKRRLDHLTWEEKLQRKKLKNRVAAQTSRDRKKAKLDELEDTVRALKESNDMLTEECSLLRSQNDTLMAETLKLRKECEINKNKIDNNYCKKCHDNVNCNATSLGSAAGWSNTNGIIDDTKCKINNQDNDTLFPFDEILEHLQGTNINELDEFAEDLLREVTAQIQANTNQSNEQTPVTENTIEKSDDTERMVGTSSKNVDTSRISKSINNINDYSSLAPCIVPILSDDILDQQTIQLNNNDTEGSFDINIKKENKTAKNNLCDTVYGTYDEATNCITILCQNDGDNINSIKVNEIIQDDDLLKNSHLNNDSIKNSPAYTFTDSLSPSSINSDDSDLINFTKQNDSNLSDYGYESHDSLNIDKYTTNCCDELADIPYELFPSLV